MKKILEFALGIKFIYDDETELLTLTDLGGMTCGHNKLEDDFSCSGLFHAAVDSYRFEGTKWKYSLVNVSEDEFRFRINDRKGLVEVDAVWQIRKEYNLVSCRYTLKNVSDREITVRRALPRFVFALRGLSKR